MIALLDYGAGNVRSVQKALEAAGGEVSLVASLAGMRNASAVVLPGVGAFDDCLNAMARQELLESVRDFIDTEALNRACSEDCERGNGNKTWVLPKIGLLPLWVLQEALMVPTLASPC